MTVDQLMNLLVKFPGDREVAVQVIESGEGWDYYSECEIDYLEYEHSPPTKRKHAPRILIHYGITLND